MREEGVRGERVRGEEGEEEDAFCWEGRCV